MADSNVTRSMPGITLVGDRGKFSGLAYIVLRGSDGYDRALWVDTTGDLRIADIATVEAAGHNPDSDGTVVGAMS